MRQVALGLLFVVGCVLLWTMFYINADNSHGNQIMPYTLPELAYSYDALEPYMTAEPLKIHHQKHHQSYINKLNAALEKHPDYANVPLVELLKTIHSLPEDLQDALRKHGGGTYNHSFFWKVMKPNGGGVASGQIAQKINEAFGSFDAFKDQFSAQAKTLFGSGWVWLVLNDAGNVEIVQTQNQICPLSDGKFPLLTLDIWEHAYYLQFQNRRPEYVDAFWNVVNWDQVEHNYKALTQ